MKIFLSWSGVRSKAVAEFLGDWLSCVLQGCRPWISTRDIDRGALWFGEIHDQLKDTTVGIVVLTQENKVRPWILFEAGALAKGLTTARVCTFLVDLQPKDVDDPLAQFNHTTPDRDGVKALVLTLNNSLGEFQLRERVISNVFDTYWPQFESDFAKAISTTKAAKPPPPREPEDLLGEILENTRALNSRVRELEASSARRFVLKNTNTVATSPAVANANTALALAVDIVDLVAAGNTFEEAKSVCDSPSISMKLKLMAIEKAAELLKIRGLI